MRLIEGPAVWRGSELERSPGWLRRLSAAELAALQRQTDATNEAPTATEATTEAVTSPAGSAVEPELQALGAELRQVLELGCGLVRLTGLALDGLDESWLARWFLTLSRHIGTPVSQTVDGDRLFRVADAGLKRGDAKARGPNSRNALTFHSDRCDVIGFLCLRQAAQGGDNLVVSAGSIHNEIAATRPDLLECLYQPFYWQRHNIDGANEHPWYRMPVFAVTEGHFAVTLMQVLIERAHKAADLPDLSPDQAEALALVQQLAQDPRFHIRFAQRPGEVLLLNNYATLHSRTAFDDPPHAPGRLLLRVWLSVPDNRPLPPSWAAHYGEHRAGRLRGGIRTGG